ncbi:hypothetical protein CNBG_2894 [Cryptococcus deuterogattii R265]|uniref:uncharacterized protein n=1 Tax=Cryptococcus deuterogattii (strain R265) TaxID=294750 RepID=UPI0019387980|nr:hypothetical protein CNBG_2894 [Cryptococcus deuterogattii R265]
MGSSCVLARATIQKKTMKSRINYCGSGKRNDCSRSKALDKQSIQTRMAAIYWGMKRHTDEFSWGKEGMRVRHISLDQVAQCSNLEELDELSTIDTMSLKCPNKHSRE